ncbi:hypothetical protein Tco_0185443 [Tanacetum coccineum]
MKMRAMFLLYVAMVVLTTPATARLFATRSLVDTNDDLAIRDDDFHLFYDDKVNLELGIDGDQDVPFLLLPSNAPALTPKPSHKHKHKHEHKSHHHKHEHKDHHHKHEHEHKDHHHKHNPHHGSHALSPNAPVVAPAQAPVSSWTWFW